MAQEETGQELLDSLESAAKKIKDQDQLRLVKSFARIARQIDDVKNFVETISDDHMTDEERPELESVIQDVEAKMLDTNGNLLEFIDIVTEQATLGKSEISEYFMDMVRSIIKDFKIVNEVLIKWKRAIKNDPSSIKGEMLEKSLTWLRSRTSGPLIRIMHKNLRLAKMMDKLRKEQVVSEVYKYICESYGIKQ